MIEGSTSAKKIEYDFNVYLGSGWKCTTIPISPDTDVLRLPNVREVDKACYNERMTLKNCMATGTLKKCYDSVGSQGVLNIAWVNVGNIPLDKRNK